MASGAAAAPGVQTVVLRVAIHCHGCKKKVRKVLRSIPGVENVTVDASQHKVTVTGTVDADTLIQKLYKSGKKGETWQFHPPSKKTEPAPEAPPPARKPAGDGAKDAAPAPAAAPAADKKPEEAVKEKEPAAPKPAGDGVKESKDAAAAAPPADKKPEQEGGAVEKKPAEAESKKEEKVEAKKDGGDSKAKAAAEPAKGADETKAKAAAEPAKGTETKAKAAAEPAKEAAAPAPATAANDKPKDEAKKSDDKPKDSGKQAEPAAVTTTERSLPMPPAPKHASYEQEYRQPYYAPQPVVSYHASHPSSSVSYTYIAPQAQPAYSMQQPHHPPQQSSYYSTYQPQPSYSYSAQPPQPEKQWSPSYLYMPYPQHSAVPTAEPYYQQQQDHYGPPGMHASPMHDSYRIFDDENPNSCSVM